MQRGIVQSEKNEGTHNIHPCFLIKSLRVYFNRTARLQSLAHRAIKLPSKILNATRIYTPVAHR